jgi:beta-lactamase regulating signal transducer with metallopeptidase domain
MKKINKNLALYFILAFVLSVFTLGATQKFSQVLLQKGITSCQEFLQTISLPIPHNASYLLFALTLVILLISLAKFAFTILKIYLFHRDLNKNRISQQSFNEYVKKLSLSDQTVLIQSDKPFGFCFGLRRPKIYISTAAVLLLSKTELKAVLYHEEAHLKNRDNYTLFFISLVQSLFPFFPLFSDLLHTFRIERELRADHDATKKLYSVKPLLSALNKLLNQSANQELAYAPAIASERTLEQRIKYLAGQHTSSTTFKVRNIIVSVTFVVLLTGILFMPFQAVEVHHEEHDMLLLASSSEVQAISCHASAHSERSVKSFI